MAKVFKIIMNILLILLIAAMCAVFVPPFVGISTTVTSEGSESNIPTGAIVYTTREALENLEVGDEILTSLYICEITEIDETNRELTVSYSGSDETGVIQLSRAATKVIIVIPFLGYILLALQSFEGFIILAVTCALIVILFIIATVLRNQAAYEDEEELDEQDGDLRYFQELAEGASKPSKLDKLGTFSMPELDGGDVSKTQEINIDPVPSEEEAKEISRLMFESTDKVASEPKDELTGASDDESSDEQKEEPKENPKDEHKERTKDEQLDAHKEEPEDAPKDTPKDAPKNKPGLDGSETAELLSAIKAFESSLEEEGGRDEVPVSGSDTKEILSVSDIQEPVKSDAAEIELAIPIRSLDELLQEAYSRGEDPQVVKDEVTGITFVDYSSCF